MVQVFSILLISVAILATSQAFNLEGGIVNCLKDIPPAVKSAKALVADIRAKAKFDKILEDLLDLSLKLADLATDCSDPMCLKKAKQNCEADTHTECEIWGAIYYPKCK
jgi:hypothetical protein